MSFGRTTLGFARSVLILFFSEKGGIVCEHRDRILSRSYSCFAVLPNPGLKSGARLST